MLFFHYSPIVQYAIQLVQQAQIDYTQNRQQELKEKLQGLLTLFREMLKDPQTTDKEREKINDMANELDIRLKRSELREFSSNESNHIFFMLRHFENDFQLEDVLQGITNPPLNRIGREQGKEHSKNILLKRATELIYTDVLRCQQTAQLIAEATRLTPKTVEWLQPRSYGDIRLDPALHQQARQLYAKKSLNEFNQFIMQHHPRFPGHQNYDNHYFATQKVLTNHLRGLINKRANKLFVVTGSLIDRIAEELNCNNLEREKRDYANPLLFYRINEDHFRVIDTGMLAHMQQLTIDSSKLAKDDKLFTDPLAMALLQAINVVRFSLPRETFASPVPKALFSNVEQQTQVVYQDPYQQPALINDAASLEQWLIEDGVKRELVNQNNAYQVFAQHVVGVTAEELQNPWFQQQSNLQQLVDIYFRQGTHPSELGKSAAEACGLLIGLPLEKVQAAWFDYSQILQYQRGTAYQTLSNNNLLTSGDNRQSNTVQLVQSLQNCYKPVEYQKVKQLIHEPLDYDYRTDSGENLIAYFAKRFSCRKLFKEFLTSIPRDTRHQMMQAVNNQGQTLAMQLFEHQVAMECYLAVIDEYIDYMPQSIAKHGQQNLLMIALQHKQAPIARNIIHRLAKPGETHEMFHQQDVQGKSVLHYAKDLGDKRVIKMLMDRGADPHQRDYMGQTAQVAPPPKYPDQIQYACMLGVYGIKMVGRLLKSVYNLWTPKPKVPSLSAETNAHYHQLLSQQRQILDEFQGQINQALLNRLQLKQSTPFSWQLEFMAIHRAELNRLRSKTQLTHKDIKAIKKLRKNIRFQKNYISDIFLRKSTTEKPITTQFANSKRRLFPVDHAPLTCSPNMMHLDQSKSSEVLGITGQHQRTIGP